ncbi:MAG: glycosyl transferase, partial [Candidatus Omnitrophica bacterium]|nr:glycosyl transferase [Candidatus Omnitrophota bacterium]
FVPDHKEVETLLSACAIGLALYEPDPQSLTWYTDPSKPKQYMPFGLPVIITDVPWIAQEVKAKGLGLVSEYKKESFVKAAVKLLTDDKFYRECRENAIEFASNLEWGNIFENALSCSLKN